MKKLISNPNFIYIISFIVPFVFYTLEWSTLYPALSSGLFIFYVFTFVVCALLGIFINHIKPFNYSAVPVSNSNRLVLFVMYFLYVVEIIYSRKLPLLGLLTGSFSYSEDSFGIPVIHTFLVSFNTFFSIYLFHQYISNKKRALFYSFILSVLPFILLVYRSSILSVLIGVFVVYLLSREKISGKTVAKSIVGIVFVLYLFGFLGNLRSGQGDRTYIPRSSGATEKFLNGPVPFEFYWSYLYIASPVANLQNNIDHTTRPAGTFKQLAINECLPNFFIKFLPFLQVPVIDFYQINPFLNVGTTYVYSYSYLGWSGMLIFFFYFIILINLYYLIVARSAIYKVTGLAVLFNIIVFANFHNTISYSASSVQMIYPVIFSMLKGFNYRIETSVQG